MIAITHILCPVDFSESSTRAAAYAIAMAKWYEARLTLLHVWVNQGAVDLPPIVLGVDERAQFLDDMRRLCGPHEGVSLDFLVREAPDVPREILDQTAALGIDLLVLGSHGRTGVRRLLLGSVTENLLRRGTVPLMVVPRGAPDAKRDRTVQLERILCPVDFSEGSLAALTYALSIAQESDADLTVMHAIEIPPELSEHMPPADFNLDAIRAAAVVASLQRLRDLIPDSARTFCRIDTIVREGAAYRQVLQVAEERRSDLIVMGVQGRGALDLLVFGSNTARLTRAATCPVLVIRQPN
jgi:nucleotide-binding universal stress UspA family protein